MDEGTLRAALVDLPLGGLRFFTSIGSTNDEALAWATAGAKDLSVVIADEQTAGRGRAQRRWYTPPGSALALSIILRPSQIERSFPARITGLGALALVHCLDRIGLQAQIKWPNDILLNGRKVAGVLVESTWAGNRLDGSVLGVGVNVGAAAVPTADQLSFPATSLETELGRPVQRLTVLKELLNAILAWRPRIGEPEFIHAWEARLAYRGQQVLVGREGERELRGVALGLEADGSLRLMSDNTSTIVHFGEIRLRPTDDRIG